MAPVGIPMNDSTQDADLFPCEGTNDYPWPRIQVVEVQASVGCSGIRYVLVISLAVTVIA